MSAKICAWTKGGVRELRAKRDLEGVQGGMTKVTRKGHLRTWCTSFEPRPFARLTSINSFEIRIFQTRELFLVKIDDGERRLPSLAWLSDCR